MDLAGWVVVPEELAGDDRDRVFLVVDVGDVQVRVDVVCKVLVSHLKFDVAKPSRELVRVEGTTRMRTLTRGRPYRIDLKFTVGR